MNDENKIFDEMAQDVTASVTVEDFARALELEILFSTQNKMTLTTVNVNRLGMQLTGFFEHFAFSRIQIMGEMELPQLLEIAAVVDSVKGTNLAATLQAEYGGAVQGTAGRAAEKKTGAMENMRRKTQLTVRPR